MTESTKRTAPVIVAAIVVIGALEAYALYQGINGTIFVLVVGAVCALGGERIGRFLEHRCVAKNNRTPEPTPRDEDRGRE